MQPWSELLEPYDLSGPFSDQPQSGHDQLLCDLAKAADVCLKPYRHALRYSGDPPQTIADCSDCALLIEARDPEGERRPERDLELEIYRSGSDLNLMLTRLADDRLPILWHGSHAVWMQASSGERCDRPGDGEPLEALCRRIRALLVGERPEIL